MESLENEKRYVLTTDLFLLPNEQNDQILYAPLVGYVALISDGMISLLNKLDRLSYDDLSINEMQLLDHLEKKNILNGSALDVAMRPTTEFVPENMALFPTNQCQLRCRYCYASAGQQASKTMDWDIASTAIQHFITFLKQHDKKVFNLEFHGGGEPFCAFPLVKKIVVYAQKQCTYAGLQLNVHAGTNGMMSEAQLVWIAKNFSYLTVSFEGLQDVQDYQRPSMNGSSSFTVVQNSLKVLDSLNFPYAIRCTVSSMNENRLSETLDCILQTYHPREICIEPISLCGRAMKDPTLKSPDMSKFISNYIDLEKRAQEQGVALIYSAGRYERLSATFCHVGSNDFAVTTSGHMTNCFQVCEPEDPLSDIFFFGRVIPGRGFDIDSAKLKRLKNICVVHQPHCQDCFAKWHCAGDCSVHYTSNLNGPRDRARCQVTRQLMASRIIQNLPL